MGKPIGVVLTVDGDEMKVGARVNFGGYANDFYNGVITKVTKKKFTIKWDSGNEDTYDLQK